MTILIKNLSRDLNQEGVYIGRGMMAVGRPASPLANPFSIKEHRSRLAVLTLYKEWLTKKIQNKDPQVCRELARLQKLAQVGEVSLLCWCAPKYACHGDIIKEFLETQDFSEFRFV